MAHRTPWRKFVADRFPMPRPDWLPAPMREEILEEAAKRLGREPKG